MPQNILYYKSKSAAHIPNWRKAIVSCSNSLHYKFHFHSSSLLLKCSLHFFKTVKINFGLESETHLVNVTATLQGNVCLLLTKKASKSLNSGHCLAGISRSLFKLARHWIYYGPLHLEQDWKPQINITKMPLGMYIVSISVHTVVIDTTLGPSSFHDVCINSI